MSDLSKPAAVGVRLSAMMFIQFFIWGAWFVSVGNYMVAKGMLDMVPWAYTVGPIAAVVSPFFLGLVADRFFATERVLGVLHLLGGAAMLCAPAAAGLGAHLFIIVLLLHTLCYMPTLGLVNSLSFHHLTSQEKQFPYIRVFGTLGWIAANLVISKLFHADASSVQFYVTGVAAIVLGLYSFTLPHTPPPAAGKKISLREILGLDALVLLKQRSFLVFLVSSFLICIPLSAYYAYAPVFVSTTGIKAIAATMSFGQMSEIIFMLLIPFFFTRFGVKWMLAAGMLAWVVRYGFFAIAPNAGGWEIARLISAGGTSSIVLPWLTPGFVLAGIILHGICYDFFFVTGSIYTDKVCAREIRGQAQGLLVLATYGLGLGIGAQISGRVVAAFTTGPAAQPVIHWPSVWLFPCVMALVVLLVFTALFREKAQS